MSNNKKFSLIILSITFVFLVQNKNYPIGSLESMKFGFFPWIIISLCLFLGIVLFFMKDSNG